MTNLIATNRNIAILGLGATGLSVARFLSSIGKSFVFADSRTAPPRLAEVREAYPDVPVVLGPFEADLLLGFDSVVVSPGIALQEPALVAAQQQKKLNYSVMWNCFWPTPKHRLFLLPAPMVRAP